MISSSKYIVFSRGTNKLLNTLGFKLKPAMLPVPDVALIRISNRSIKIYPHDPFEVVWDSYNVLGIRVIVFNQRQMYLFDAINCLCNSLLAVRDAIHQQQLRQILYQNGAWGIDAMLKNIQTGSKGSWIQ